MSNTRKQPVAFRFAARTLRDLRQRAQDTGLTQTALAERYIEEGMKRDQHPLIWFRDRPAGRRAGLVGSRLDVGDVIEAIRQNNNSIEEAADYLNLPIEKVQACVRYYADYKDEIDAWIQAGQEAADRLDERLQREQEALA